MHSAPDSTSPAAALDGLAAILLNTISDLVCAIDPSYRIIAANDGYIRESARLFGASVSVGQNLLDTLDHLPEHRARAKALWTRVLAGENFTTILTFAGAGGDEHYECRFSPIYDGPTLRGAMHISRDITTEIRASHEAAAALCGEQQARARLRAVLESIADAFIVVDALGQTTYVNPAAERLLSLDSAVLLGQDLRERLNLPALHPGGRSTLERGGRVLEVQAQPSPPGGLFLYLRDITEQRSIQELQARYHLAFDQLVVGVVLCQADGTLVEVNPGFARLLSYTPGELKGRNIYDLTHPDDRQIDRDNAQRVLQGEQTGYTMEKRFLRSDGSTIWTLVNANVVRDEQGNLFAAGIVQDISKRKRAEAALRESEANYRNFVELNPHFPWTASPDCPPTGFNERWLALTGITRDTSKGDIWSQSLHPLDRDRAVAAWQRSLATGEPCNVEHRTLLHDGGHRWMHTRAWPLRNEAGHIVRWYGSTEDIHERKTSEEALAASRQRFQAIFDEAFEFIFLLSPDGALLEANRTALDFAQVELAEVQHRPFWNTPWWPEASREQLRRAIAEAAAGNFIRYETGIAGAASASVIDFSVRPVYDPAGQVVLLIPEGRDITAQREAEAERDRQRQLFERIAHVTPDLLYVYDMEQSRNVYVNSQITRLLGYSTEQVEAFGSNLLPTLVHPDDLPLVTRSAQKLAGFSDDEVLQTEYRMQHSDGRWRWLSGRDVILSRGAAGAPRLVLGQVTDITERKQMEEQLRRAREQFAIAAAATCALVYDWNLETGYVERVCGLKELTGWDPAEVPATASWWRDQIHPEDIGRVGGFGRTIQPGQPASAEYRIRRRDGRYITVRDTAVLLTGRDGEPVRCVGSSVDISSEREAQAALLESEQHFRNIAEAMPHIAYVATGGRAVEYANCQLLDYAGLPLDSLTPDVWSTLIHPDDYPAAMEAWDRAAREVTVGQVELRLRTRSGDWRWMLHRMVPLRASHGHVERWLGTLTDIHDRHAAEEELRASEAQFRHIAGAVPQIVWINRADGEGQWHNRRWFEYTGATEELSDGVGWTRFVHPEDIDRACARWQASLSSGDAYEILYRLRRYDGEYRWMLARAVPIYDGAGVITHWFGTCTDVHEQKRLEDALRASEQKLQLALSAADLGIWSFDPATGNVDWDQRTREIFGVGASDRIDYEKVVWNIAHPDDRARVNEVATRALSPDGNGRYDIEHRIVLPDGQQRWLMISGCVIFAGDGASRTPVRMTGTVADVTARKATEEALIRSNQDLERFASMASHDLREPLRSIRSFAELLERRYKGKLDATADQYLAHVVGGAERMGKLIDDLLAFARITGDIEPVAGPADCAEALHTALHVLQPAIEDSGAEITFDPLPVLHGHAALLPQLFQNLIGNAIKYRRDGVNPKVHVGAVEQPGRWLFHIRDNGCGFEPEDSTRIFSVFTRLHGGRNTGAGLGLAICHRIVERHHGKIWAESTPGVGSTFWFTLPT